MSPLRPELKIDIFSVQEKSPNKIFNQNNIFPNFSCKLRFSLYLIQLKLNFFISNFAMRQSLTGLERIFNEKAKKNLL